MRRCLTAVPALALLLAACSSDDTTGPGQEPPTPANLTSVSLDGAVALSWSDNAYTADPDNFLDYRIYSTSYDLDNDACGTTWSLEGTNVAPEFIVAALENGVPKCFSVTAESVDLVESDRSQARNDTPRPDGRNVLVYTRQTDDSRSAFRFGETAQVLPGTSPNADFTVERDVTDAILLVPSVSLATGVEFYGNERLADLTEIDFAPDIEYSLAPIDALPGRGYVFEIDGGDGFARYGALRLLHVGLDFVIFDWAYQTDPGNPELVIGGR